MLWNVGRFSTTAAKRPSFRHQPAALSPRQAALTRTHRHDSTVLIYLIQFVALKKTNLGIYPRRVLFLWDHKPVLGLGLVSECM